MAGSDKPTVDFGQDKGEEPSRVKERNVAAARFAAAVVDTANATMKGVDIKTNRGRIHIEEPAPAASAASSLSAIVLDAGKAGDPAQTSRITDLQVMSNQREQGKHAFNMQPFAQSPLVVQAGVSAPDGSIYLARQGVDTNFAGSPRATETIAYYKGKLQAEEYKAVGDKIEAAALPTGVQTRLDAVLKAATDTLGADGKPIADPATTLGGVRPLDGLVKDDAEKNRASLKQDQR